MYWKAFAAMIAFVCPLLGMHLPLSLLADAAVLENIARLVAHD